MKQSKLSSCFKRRDVARSRGISGYWVSLSDFAERISDGESVERTIENGRDAMKAEVATVAAPVACGRRRLGTSAAARRPPHPPRYLHYQPQLGPLVFFGDQVALDRAGEAALRADRQPVKIDEFAGLVDAATPSSTPNPEFRLIWAGSAH